RLQQLSCKFPDLAARLAIGFVPRFHWCRQRYSDAARHRGSLLKDGLQGHLASSILHLARKSSTDPRSASQHFSEFLSRTGGPGVDRVAMLLPHAVDRPGVVVE